jgi:hypothetical protein
MEDDREQTIRQRAYTIWEEEGRPQGEDMRHWLRAWQELSASDSAANDASALNSPDAGAAAAEPSPIPSGVVAAPVKSRKKKAQLPKQQSNIRH